jgi:hypothetical protein
MSAIRKVVAGWVVGAFWIPVAMAAGPAADATANASGALPGDDALTCDQIYAQGMAETQRAQQERNKDMERRRMETGGMMALAIGASTVGGFDPSHASAIAANQAAQGMADKTIGELKGPPANPRMDHLRQLWAQKHCVKK